ncbi:hypothetical protein JQ617_25125 [Bradyrhizobium sp. KB893862 SZCCT0404]|uniref:hypothetical protein n=1 Tax=Bradyrhizobium sp. KB893862 SZCCT0404 TaxID=2807672 RepID=UPI001BA73574|nr:hypothetical protein [Bradyrhizobium sp. KB893862 SZCCT0404]MBR1177259.1 hypothetical protein [Bradyrhizobium sp. KB893862 SZCCT0404]
MAVTRCPRRQIIVGILAALAGSYVAPSHAAFLSETVRYRLTFEVDLDGSSVSASGVIQVKQSDTRPVLRSMGGFGNEVTGEAVVVDLGPRGTFFSLLRGPKVGFGSLGAPAWLLFHAFADLLKSETDPLPKVRLLKELRPRRTLHADEIPMLVRFRDLNDPKSVEQVDPANLVRTFGSGIVLREVVIEVTNDPITVGIDTKLPWLKTIKTQLDGDRLYSGATLANELNAQDFDRRSR